MGLRGLIYANVESTQRKVSTILIWIKRLTPPLVLAILIGGYLFFNRSDEQRRLQRDDLHARATAEVWVAMAEYRDSTAQFYAVRDSILDRYGITGDEIADYLDRYRKRPELYNEFARLVSRYVDSLTAQALRDTLKEEAETGGRAGAAK